MAPTAAAVSDFEGSVVAQCVLGVLPTFMPAPFARSSHAAFRLTATAKPDWDEASTVHPQSKKRCVVWRSLLLLFWCDLLRAERGEVAGAQT